MVPNPQNGDCALVEQCTNSHVDKNSASHRYLCLPLLIFRFPIIFCY